MRSDAFTVRLAGGCLSDPPDSGNNCRPVTFIAVGERSGEAVFRFTGTAKGVSSKTIVAVELHSAVSRSDFWVCFEALRGDIMRVNRRWRRKLQERDEGPLHDREPFSP